MWWFVPLLFVIIKVSPVHCTNIWSIKKYCKGNNISIILSPWYAAAAAAKSLQSCPTLWDPRDSSPPGSPIPGILQAGTLEWVAISFSNAWNWKVKGKSLSRVRPSATPWTAAFQAPQSMEFSRQEYWSGVPLPSPRTSELFINSPKIDVGAYHTATCCRHLS